MEENKESPTKDGLKDEFKKADEKFDKIQKEGLSKVKLKKKMFMTISDVDTEDAVWFKKFCDEHFDGKQFLGIKVIRNVMELSEFTSTVMHKVDDLSAKLDVLARIVEQMQNVPESEPERPKVQIPKTQGSALKRN